METVCPRDNCKRAWRAFKNKDDLKKHIMDSCECLPKWRLFIHWDQQDVHELEEAEEWMFKQQKDGDKQSWNEMPDKEPGGTCFYCEVNNGMQWVKTKKSKKWVVCCQTCADPFKTGVDKDDMIKVAVKVMVKVNKDASVWDVKKKIIKDIEGSTMFINDKPVCDTRDRICNVMDTLTGKQQTILFDPDWAPSSSGSRPSSPIRGTKRPYQ